jgi:hypothetical protein
MSSSRRRSDLLTCDGPLCGPERECCSRCAEPHSGPRRAKRGQRYWRPAKGFRGDIKGRNPSAGSTLVEALIAALVFTTGLLAMAELVRIATTSNVRARSRTVAGILAGQKLEQLRSLAWEFDLGGLPMSDPELRPSPLSLHRNTPGFVDHVDGSGVVVGRDALAPASAVYTRRWSVEALAASSEHVVLIQVLVSRAQSRDAVDTRSVARLPGDARLVTIKTRKVR